MLWFRVASISCILAVFLFDFGLQWVIFEMFLLKQNQKAMEEDPTFNGTSDFYIILLFFQMWIGGTAIFGLFVAFKIWSNNYQLDHKLRRWFTIWLSCWATGSLILIAVAVWGLTREQESQHAMPLLFNTFNRYSTDTDFVAMFERFQRESNCCGIYGPDDWLMVQLRQNLQHGGGGMGGAGGGGGGYQSMDYGFRSSNPSTGQCHLTPPTIPMGCGKKINDIVHARVSAIAGVIIFQAIVGLAAGVLSWYCFFYWLDKEVLIIPEDEVSNMIVVEPESSQSMDIEGNGQYLPLGGSLGGYLGESPYLHPADLYLSPELASVRYLEDPVYGPSRHPSRYHAGPDQSYYDQPLVRSASRYVERSRLGSRQSSRLTQNMSVPYPSRIPSRPWRPNEGNSRYTNFRESNLYTSQREARPPSVAHPRISVIRSGRHREHSQNHQLHKQELALGGRVLGEMHVDHDLDDEPMNPTADVARGERGHKAHHATIALVRNKNPKPPKRYIFLFDHHLLIFLKFKHFLHTITDYNNYIICYGRYSKSKGYNLIKLFLVFR